MRDSSDIRDMSNILVGLTVRLVAEGTRPIDGKIKAAHCGPVGRGRNEPVSAPWRNVHF